MKFAYLLPVLAIVILSGCIKWPGNGNNFVGGTDVIKVFEIVPGSTKLFSTEPYSLEVKVKNADTNLLNPPIKTKVILSNPTCEVESVKPVCPANSNPFGTSSITGWGCQNLDLQPIGDTPTGESVIWNVLFKQRDIAEIAPQCTFDILTDYEYETSGLTSIAFRTTATEQSVQEPTKGTGPVKVYFKVEEAQPIKVTSSPRPFRINLYIEKAKHPSSDEKEVRLVGNEIEITDIDLFKKFPNTVCTINGKDVEINAGDKIEGISGDLKVIPCKSETPTNEDSTDVVVKAKYSYQIVYRTPQITVTYR